MYNLLIIFIILFLIVLIYIIISKCVISRLKKFKKGKVSNKINLLYDDYYDNSKNISSTNNKLLKNIGIVREKNNNNEYDFDIELLNLKENEKYKVLIINSYDINFDIELSNKYNDIEIISTCDNILEANSNKNLLGKNKNIFVSYLNVEDVYYKFKDSDFKFDRIILRENLGNIKNRKKFLKNIKNLLNYSKNEKPFILIKTFVFQPVFTIEEFSNEKNIYFNHIFDKQKKIIDYWNYNFSTAQYIINDLKDLDYSSVIFSQIPVLYLLFTSSIKDIINILKLYFYHMNLDTNNLNEWESIKNIELFYIKAN